MQAVSARSDKGVGHLDLKCRLHKSRLKGIHIHLAQINMCVFLNSYRHLNVLTWLEIGMNGDALLAAAVNSLLRHTVPESW